jgi:uncharacterized protein
MPGATLDSVDGDEMTGRVKVKVGPMAMTYKGTARFVDRDDSNHSIAMEASGKDVRGSGGARAKMTMNLVDLGEDTKCTVQTDLSVSGKAAQFGRGVMADVSAKLVDEFARRLAQEVGNPTTGRDCGGEAAGTDVRTEARTEARRVDSPQRDDTINLLEAIDATAAIRRAAPVLALVAVLWLVLRRRSGG